VTSSSVQRLVVVSLVAALVGSACGPERRERPAPAVEGPRVSADPPRSGFDTAEAEDPNQLTADEQARLAQLVEGSSEIPACDAFIRHLRLLGACKRISSSIRTLYQRSALMFADALSQAGSGAGQLTETCIRVAAQFAEVVEESGCGAGSAH